MPSASTMCAIGCASSAPSMSRQAWRQAIRAERDRWSRSDNPKGTAGGWDQIAIFDKAYVGFFQLSELGKRSVWRVSRSGGFHPKAVGDDAVETVKTLAHFGGAVDDEDAGGRGKWDHGRGRAGEGASRRIRSASAAGCPWTVTGPSARSKSRRSA